MENNTLSNELELTNWLKAKISEETLVSIDEIQPETPIESLGLDSLSAVSIAYDLEKHIHMSIEPTILWEFTNIKELVKWILEKKNI